MGHFVDKQERLKLVKLHLKRIDENAKLFKQNICLAPIKEEKLLLEQHSRYLNELDEMTK